MADKGSKKKRGGGEGSEREGNFIFLSSGATQIESSINLIFIRKKKKPLLNCSPQFDYVSVAKHLTLLN